MSSTSPDPQSNQRTRLAWIALVVLAVLAVLGLRRLGPDADADAAEQDTKASAAASSGRVGAGPSPFATRPGLDLRAAAKASVSGTVRDSEARPIAGAHVCAFADERDLRGAGSLDPICTTSGADGAYRIEGLWPVLTRLSASAPSYQPGAWYEREPDGDVRGELMLAVGAHVDGLDIELEAGGVRVAGVVKDISGGEIDGAQVSGGAMRNGAWAVAVAFTDEAGAFELWVMPGVHDFVAQTEGYARGVVEAVAPGEFIEIYLTPESVLVGRVVLASTGEPVAGATVSSGRWGHTTQTDELGEFRIAGLEPGAYKPSAETEELFGQAAETVHLGLGQTSEVIELRVHPAALLMGRVLVAGGPPGEQRGCEDGNVSLVSSDDLRERASVDHRDGSVEFRGVLPGTYEVEVRCHGFMSADAYPDLVVADANQTDLVWEVREGLALRGEVVDDSGEPVEGVAVAARPVVSEAEEVRAQVTRAGDRSEPSGAFELAGLLPGSYEVSIESWGREGRPGPLEPLRVELEAGADRNDLRIVLPATGQLRGRIVDGRGEPVAGVTIRAEPVSVQDRFSRGSTTRSDDAGEFFMDHLRVGETRVSASDGGRWRGGTSLRKPGTSDDDLQGELVSVGPGETATVELVVESRGGVIRGTVRDEDGGPVADAFIDVQRMPDAAGASAARARASVRWSWSRQPVLSDQDGAFELDDLPEGEFVVRAHRKGGGEAVVEHVALGSSVELVIAATGELAGVVSLADGSAPEKFSILAKDASTGMRRRDSYLRTEGAFRLRELPAGHYVLRASSGAGNVELEVELGEGEVREDLELRLAARVTIRGRLVDLDSGAPVPGLEVFMSGGGRLRFGERDGERRHVSDADGRFEVADVPSGTVQLMARSRTGGADSKYQGVRQVLALKSEPLVQDIGEIQVVARRLDPREQAGDLGFTLRESEPGTDAGDRQLVVALVRPDGPAAATALEVGDVIERVDGHRVSGVDTSRFGPLTAAPAGTTLELGLADGETLSLVLGPPR